MDNLIRKAARIVIRFLLKKGWLWIPCSEENPKEDGKYLVTYHEYGDVGFEQDSYDLKILTYKEGQWRLPIAIPQWVEDSLTKEVIAWMPLPEPYERKEE